MPKFYNYMNLTCAECGKSPAIKTGEKPTFSCQNPECKQFDQEVDVPVMVFGDKPSAMKKVKKNGKS